jgi:hypothetical protein
MVNLSGVAQYIEATQHILLPFHHNTTMAKKSRDSVGTPVESKKSQKMKTLVADEAVVDPTLAALFASSVCFRLH